MTRRRPLHVALHLVSCTAARAQETGSAGGAPAEPRRANDFAAAVRWARLPADGTWGYSSGPQLAMAVTF